MLYLKLSIYLRGIVRYAGHINIYIWPIFKACDARHAAFDAAQEQAEPDAGRAMRFIFIVSTGFRSRSRNEGYEPALSCLVLAMPRDASERVGY